ncbi:hypothetical protein MSG28_003210 [Choristoneura fumiferana]|uniref:Uncharacterized protein n=1 Tax=Choristoneura fumiferana TaxID=7141 RepID=A0ACC0KEE0_CHOFU|nr:hypothetical protein MSG28_003210 [Choristoneura fumiferana]
MKYEKEVVSDEDGVIDPESNVAAFRITVDLSEYFQEQASCLLWVPKPRGTRTVRWLARRLRRAAALRERFCLLCDSHTLPPDEPLRLLRPGDALRVVRVEHEWQRVFSFKGERAPTASPPKPKKRRKTNTVEAEPPTLAPVAQSKPTQELTFVSKAKPLLPPPEPLLPCSRPIFSPAVFQPPSVQPTTSSAPITKPPSQDDELQRVKRRALALLQKVEGEFRQENERDGGEDETDGAGNEWPSAKKRRRRVRRRRALPPIDFEQELILSTTKSSNSVLSSASPEPSLAPAIPITSATVIEPHSTTQPILASPAIPHHLSHAAFYPRVTFFPHGNSIFNISPWPRGIERGNNPRLPRLIRALDITDPEDISQASQEISASTAPAPLPQTASDNLLFLFLPRNETWWRGEVPYPL